MGDGENLGSNKPRAVLTEQQISEQMIKVAALLNAVAKRIQQNPPTAEQISDELVHMASVLMITSKRVDPSAKALQTATHASSNFEVQNAILNLFFPVT